MTINELSFTFTVDELNTIVAALGNAPYAKAAPVIQKIEAEAQSQIQAQAEAAAESAS